MKVYGLIGKQLDHSFSKDYFDRKFQKENIVDAKFELFPIEELSLFETFINRLLTVIIKANGKGIWKCIT